jgi:chaperone modulatory protein CbpM
MSSLSETEVIARIGGLTVKRLEFYIENGWVTPQRKMEGRHYADIDLARLQFIEHLRDDMALGDEAVPVVLSLVDQIHGLRHQLRCMAQAIEAQHEDIRGPISEAFRQALAHRQDDNGTAG